MPLNIAPARADRAPVNLDAGHSAGRDRVERAKAALQGQVPVDAPAEAPRYADAQAERAIRTIKMRTNRNTDRHLTPEIPAEAPALATGLAESPTLAQVETDGATEVTGPMSPQFAALAKEKRALQVMKREIEAEKAALLAKAPADTAGTYTKEQIQANALSVLREAGVTNDALTEALLREAQDYGPGYTKLETELQALKKALDDQSKSLSERDQAAETQVLAQIDREVQMLIGSGDEFEATRDAGYGPKVTELIKRQFKETGEVLDTKDACTLIETELVEDYLKKARLKKIQERLAPQAPVAPAPAVKPDPGMRTQVMRTLTNRDGAPPMPGSRRERAIAAFSRDKEGRFK